MVSNTSNECVDVVLLFARGSGQNSEYKEITRPLGDEFSKLEKESYDFFRRISHKIDDQYPNITYKAISVHDFPGKYDPTGYAAVPVGALPPASAANTVNAEASWFPGNYRASIDGGIAEITGYLKEQVVQCPDQHYMVGGYSQGAQVMGDSLFNLTEQERSKILSIGFFGDPKFVGVSKTGDSYPWRRGDAPGIAAGMLDPRLPYVPAGMESKTISWCLKYDIVCGGWSQYAQWADSHGSYTNNPIAYATNELIAYAARQLTALERKRGGVTTDAADIYQTIENRDKKRDVMIVVNDDSNESVINTILSQSYPVFPAFARNFESTRFAAKVFGENSSGGSLIPRVRNIQSFLPLTGFETKFDGVTTSSLSTSFAKVYGNSFTASGGGDLADPYQLVLERSVVDGGWRSEPDVERNIIMIIDRPPKDTYTYDICYWALRVAMRYPETDGQKNCHNEYRKETWQKTLIPEACENIMLVIMNETCDNPSNKPAYNQMNTRTMQDTLMLAQTYKTKISIVLPRYFDPAGAYGQYNHLSNPAIRDKLKSFAEATGGTFIYYDLRTKYDGTLLDDTLWQVFTKPQRTLPTYVNGAKGSAVKVSSGVPSVLDVSSPGFSAASYRWDFNNDGTWDEVTTGPIVDHTFGVEGNFIFRVQALDTNGAVIAESRQAYSVNKSSMPTNTARPVIPSAVAAAQHSDNTTKLTWDPLGSGTYVITDPGSGLIIGNADETTGFISLPGYYDKVEVRYIQEEMISDSRIVDVARYVASTTRAVDISGQKICSSEECPITTSAPVGRVASSVDNAVDAEEDVPVVAERAALANEPPGGMVAGLQAIVPETTPKSTIIAHQTSNKSDPARKFDSVGFIVLLLFGTGTLVLIRQARKN